MAWTIEQLENAAKNNKICSDQHLRLVPAKAKKKIEMPDWEKKLLALKIKYLKYNEG